MKLLLSNTAKQVVTTFLVLLLALQLFPPNEQTDILFSQNGEEQINNWQDGLENNNSIDQSVFLADYLPYLQQRNYVKSLIWESSLRKIPNNYSLEIHIPPPNQQLIK